jgi:hypothetical protein
VKIAARLSVLATVTVTGLTLATTIPAAAAQATLWVTHQDVVNGGINVQVAASPDGAKVIVTGYNWSASPGSQPQFATVAYGSGTGAQLWVARYGQPAKAPAYGVSVAVSPDSSKVFVTGDNGNDGATVAYSS